MALNFPGPFEVRISYTTNETPVAIAAHQLRLSCNMSTIGDPGDPFSAFIPFERSGSAISNLETKVSDLMGVVRPLFVAGVDFSVAELWEYTAGSFDAIFRSSLQISLPGTGAGTTTIAGQAVLTMRTTAGGVMKVDLRGTNFAPQTTITFPVSPGSLFNLANHFLASTNIWWGRDNSYPLAALRFLPGQNEKAWRTAFRP